METPTHGFTCDFVLGNWNSEEQNMLPEIIKKAVDGVKKFGTIGLSHTMTELNKKAKKE